MKSGDLASADAGIRLAAIEALAASPAPPTSAEIAALADCLADGRKAVQRRAAECLASLAERGVAIRDALRGRLVEGSLGARWAAAYALSLAGFRDHETLETLLEVLGAPDGDLRWAAADLLQRAAASDRAWVIDRLNRVAEGEGSAAARKMAFYALRTLDARDPRTVAAAERAIDAEDMDLRLAALSAYARLCGDRIAAALRIARLIADADERVRRAAAATVGALGVRRPEVLSALDEARASADSSLRRAAERSLRLLETADP
jgi:HEAT repeat protein